jgi:hypothetical protein
MREAMLLPGARAYRDVMSDTERRAIDQRLARIERGMIAGIVATLDEPDAPAVHILDDGTWRIVHLVPDQATTGVLDVRHILDARDGTLTAGRAHRRGGRR